MSETETKVCDTCKKEIDGPSIQYFRAEKGEEAKVARTACQPCDQAERMQKFKETGFLSTWLVEEEQLKEIRAEYGKSERGDAEVLAAFAPIQAEIEVFEQEVWFGGLQDFARNIKTKGSKAEQDGLTLMCYTMCGRAMITVEDATASVTMITIEDEKKPCMGWRGIQATGPQAVDLLKRAVQLWKAGMRAVSDRDVSMGL
jgi:hypothetical protein